MIIVPFETPGLTVIRDVPIMNHHSPEGHCEIDFDVRVPAANLLGEEGDGFTIAQARLGPGRIHHCMRTIGQCELALEMMVARAKSRIAFGSALAEYANIQDWIAQSASRSIKPGFSSCAPPGSWTRRAIKRREWMFPQSRS